MTKEMTREDYENIGESFNEMIDNIAHLQVKISKSIEKTKAWQMKVKMDNAKEMISECRYDIEDIMLKIAPAAPLITSFRKYRGDN